MRTQADQIAAHLARGESLTALSALRLYGTMRLAARILELRAEGMDIDAETVTLPSGKRVARYSARVAYG